MSDFIYSNINVSNKDLTNKIRSIYDEDAPSILEYHGNWGSLAVSKNVYEGFQPYETEEHIFVVIGGPALNFQEKSFFSEDGNSKTKKLYNRWLEKKVIWDEDLSGPFTILIICKQLGKIICITDLMSFIPVFKYQTSNRLLLATHVDVIAQLSQNENSYDDVSVADFIIHGVVTYPYTFYSEIRQISPASTHNYIVQTDSFISTNYWIPQEQNMYQSIDKAAEDLRKGLEEYIKLTTRNEVQIAQFISGGEDSRMLSGILPYSCDRQAYVFLDDMNREGVRAQKAAEAYGAKFNIGKRNQIHYLEILPACSNLIGAGFEYTHAHSYKFHKSCNLENYNAVFGGLFSDALLKGARIRKVKGLARLPFLPQFKSLRYSAASAVENSEMTTAVLTELTERRKRHLEYLSEFRNESVEEWFELWPSSMNKNIPNLHVNRRLFPAYEPFMSNQVVKISALTPQKWKLNRRLFHKTAKPFLKKTKWLLHGDGRLPYFPWYINSFVQLFTWSFQQIGTKTGLVKGNQESWAEWKKLLKSDEWNKMVSFYVEKMESPIPIFKKHNLKELLTKDSLKMKERINLLQTLQIYKKNKNNYFK